jgi:hypothetical protein
MVRPTTPAAGRACRERRLSMCRLSMVARITRGAILTCVECPTCGITNPPDALTCDCGYDFVARQPSEVPGWEIRLAWRQKLAAFWSISWPAVAVSFVLSLLLLSHDSVDVARAHLTWIALAGNVSFFLVQAALTNRIVRKNYRSFRVVVLRNDGQQSRSLSARESMSVWLWVMGPQVALILITSVTVGATARSCCRRPFAASQLCRSGFGFSQLDLTQSVSRCGCSIWDFV